MAFLIDRHSIRPYRHLTTTAALVPALDELRFQLGRAELGTDYLLRHAARLQQRLHQILGDLYQQLLAPLRTAITAPRLLIVPFGPLHRLPFHALWDGHAYLIEQLTCSYAPSASVVVQRQPGKAALYQAFSPAFTTWAGLAVEDAAIPAARAEVTGAARYFADAQLYLDHAANREGLERAAQADLLHLATHGLFRPDNPFFSALKLADGWIDVRELYRLPLQARLVVLSACESGAGAVRGGDEVVGLVRGFLGAGAREVLASLWNVHDASAVPFMQHFYQFLTQEAVNRPADALRAAQCAAISSRLHPYYWASFYMIGD
jgi:CHAT domain-containing protein